MSEWIDTLAALRARGTPAVTVTVAAASGSAPREAGAKMIVTADAVHGTIGGGHLEHEATAIARDRLGPIGAGDAPLRRFALGASLGQCCGGVVNLLFETIDADAGWIDALAAAHREGRDAVVVGAADGIGPSGKLVVTPDAVHGTAAAEFDDEATAIAREMLAARKPPRLLAWRPHDAIAQPARTLFFEPVRASGFHVVLFGAGHVARALVRVLAGVACRITWVDERENEFPRDVPANVTVSCTDAPEADVDSAPPRAYFLVMTHSHALDEALAERILRRADYAYFGLIGSATKRRAFEKRIARRGIPAERFATMTCPIGVAGIPDKEPGAIAIAVAAQLLHVRARGAGAQTAGAVRSA
jgi:xanthine dehydrogenase accessory factor